VTGTARARGSRLGAAPAEGISVADRAPFGWAPLVVVFCVGLVDRVEYSIVSGVLPFIQQEWHVGDTLAGAIPTAAAVAALLVSVPAGYLADRKRRTRMIAVVVLSWSVITVGSGLAVTFAMFFATRVVLGAAENITTPVAGSLLGDFYPPVTRDRAFGWSRLTVYAGVAVGTVLGGVLGSLFGWRSAFLVMAVPGLVVAWTCWRLREPPRGFIDRLVASGGTGRVTVPEDTDVRTGPQSHPDLRHQLREVLAIRTAVLVAIGVGILTLGLTGIFYWLPSLVHRSYGVDEGIAALATGGISLVGVLGGTLLGMRLGRRWHGTRRGGRVLAGGGGILIGSVLLGVSMMVGRFGVFVAVLLVSVVIMAIAIPTLTATIADVIAASSRGVGFGALQLLITGGTAGGPLIVGLCSDVTGSLTIAMYALIVPMVFGGLVTLTARASSDRDAAVVLDRARAEGRD